MTEAGERWATERRRPNNTPNHVQAEQAEHWLRAFCDEVEKRLPVIYGRNTLLSIEHCKAIAFAELKRELLGE